MIYNVYQVCKRLTGSPSFMHCSEITQNITTGIFSFSL